MQTNILITEKPSASTKIAEALAGKKVRKKKKRGSYWYEFVKDGDEFIVLPAVGHIFALDTVKDGSGWTYPTFKTEWIPSFEKKGSEFSKKYFKNIKEVIEKKSKDKSKTNFIIATDYDTEGSVIGYNIIRFMSGEKNAHRMKFSTLTKDELNDSFENRMEKLDFNQIESGLTRHYLDFYWGINLTRALTIAMKKSADKGFAILSTGRVQGPTLDILLEKELKIRKFKPKPYWQIEADVKKNDKKLTASYKKKRMWNKKDAKNVKKDCKKKGAKAVVKKIRKRKYSQNPPVPFNTTDLQSEAYSQFKYSPKYTLRIVESLYQAGAVSYPRSSSQKLPPSIDYKKIIKSLSKLKTYSGPSQELLTKSKLEPNEGKKKDPAHPAIYPTSETPKLSKLSNRQRKMYDLIVRRFLSVFSEKTVRESVTVELDVNGHKFKLKGKKTLEPGWTRYYKKFLSFEDQELPDMKKDDELEISKIRLGEKETNPPGRYSQGSILKKMESKGLGTRATRAEILQTLYNRKYINGKSIKVTKLGETVTKVLKGYCPRILSEEMTKKFEKEMEDVAKGEKKREKIVQEAKELLTDTLKDFKKKEKKIGKKLLKGLIEARKEENDMGDCPNCDNRLKVIVSKRTKKRFVGCGGYPKCKTGFPLPQNGYITKLNRPCKECGMMMIKVNRKGKRPYTMCINHKCKTKESWVKDKVKKKKKKSRKRIEITDIKGIGEKGAEILKKSRVTTAKSLLRLRPETIADKLDVSVSTAKKYQKRAEKKLEGIKGK